MDEKQDLISFYVSEVLKLKKQERQESSAIEYTYQAMRSDLAKRAEKDGVLDAVREQLWSM